jgi:hypothetical protein
MRTTQIETLQKKIAEIKRRLAAEKRKFGGYDDSRGLRYLPTKYFIQLGDYKGGLKYTKWFAKQFPDDCGLPDFLFEWVVILFKNGFIEAAEEKAFKTFCSNTYLFDKFFGKPIAPIDKREGSNLEAPSYIEHFDYKSGEKELADFGEWLNDFISSERFNRSANQFLQYRSTFIKN